MKTKATIKIDDIEIIAGLGNADGFIDDEATMLKVHTLISTTDEQKNFDAVAQKVKDAITARDNAFSLIPTAQNQTDKENYIAQYQKCIDNVKALEPECLTAYNAVAAKIESLKSENLQYHGLPQGETMIADDEALKIETAFSNLKEGQFVGSDLSVITDYRGKYVFTLKGLDWTTRQISKLGDVPAKGEILESDLTSDQVSAIVQQVETKRIASLSPADKAYELSQKISALKTQAGRMYNEETVAGSSTALADSQSWLLTQTAALNKIYGVS